MIVHQLFCVEYLCEISYCEPIQIQVGMNAKLKLPCREGQNTLGPEFLPWFPKYPESHLEVHLQAFLLFPIVPIESCPNKVRTCIRVKMIVRTGGHKVEFHHLYLRGIQIKYSKDMLYPIHATAVY